MKEKLLKFWEKIKTSWLELKKSTKIIIIIAASVILIGAIIITIVLNVKAKEDYIVLFPDMSSTEATEVYLELQNMGVETKINSKGEIEVPAEQWDDLVYKLAQLGYPQSVPSYGTFFDNLKMTMTEFEKKQTLRFELQDRLQNTISRIDGIKGVVVNISVPEGKEYAWSEDEQKASATVTLTLIDPISFTADKVSAIKKLVAYSAQQMEPSDVKVINANSGLELLSAEEIDENKEEEFEGDQRVYYENIIKSQLEKNAEKILAKIYGKDGVVAVATVSVDYDKVSQEIKELITNEDGMGVMENQHIEYGTHNKVDPGGIVGEEDNSDIPNYGNLEDDLSSDDAVYYERDTEWAIGYILTQKEQAIGLLNDASIAVVVTSQNVLSNSDREALVDLVKNATNIAREKISVYSNRDIAIDPNPLENPTTETLQDMLKPFIIIITIVVLTALLIIALVVYLLTRNARRKMEEERETSQNAICTLQNTIEETKKQSLIEAAQQHNEEEQSTANEVKNFVKQNPEVTAAIIRAMLKEDE